MTFDRHLEERNVRIQEDNSLPPGQRSQKMVKRIIAAVRAAESDFQDALKDANDKCRQAQAQVIALQEQLRKANEEIRKMRARDVVDSIESLTVGDRKRLLEVS